MSVYHVMDNRVVSQPEFRQKVADLPAPVAAFATTESAPNGFTPIGKGKPLTIMIRDVYTGEHPHSGFFGNGGDVAVVSGVKNYDVFNASTRALNFLAKDQAPRSHMRRPAAFSDGSALVAYSPAIMTSSVTISFELAVANFPQAFVNSLSTAFTSMAGIPLLLPYSGYLLGAGALFKVAGNIGHALFDGVRFAVTDSIDFDLPGSAPATADFRVLVGSGFDISGFQYREGVGLCDPDGRKYAGDQPYVVISLDGAPKDELKTFMPTVASAAILQRFFQVQDGAQVSIDAIVQGLQLASDLKYRDQSMALKAKLDAATTQEDKDAIQQQLDAALKNISTDALKPK
jgi:hypothetical protein